MAIRRRPSSAFPLDRAALPILEASPNAVLGIAADGTIVYASPKVRDTFGWTPQDLLGSKIERLVPRALAAQHVAHRAEFAAQPTARPMGIGLDLAAVRRDGTEFPVEISLVPLPGPDGLLVLVSVVDISARRALEEELFEARKLESIGRLAGGIAHDFNNILTAIIGFADLALVRPAGDDGAVELRTIKQAAQRASGLTQQLLAFGRRQLLRPEIIDPNDVVADTEPLLRRLIGENIEVIVSVTDSLGKIQVDPTQLGQVIMNLALNARDAMPDGGRLVIRTERPAPDEGSQFRRRRLPERDYFVVSVTDTGAGMDDATKAHIFEPFFTTKEPGKGTGLGLSTTYGIVKQSGGHITLHSEVGRGTTFRILFPTVDEPLTHDSEDPEPATPRHRGRIILVEDDVLLRQLTRRILTVGGYQVVEAPSSTDAQELVEEGDFDLLVSDVVMPGVSGGELARRLRKVRPALGVVLMSGYAEELVLDEDHDFEFVAKPFTSQAMLAAVGAALREAERPADVMPSSRSSLQSQG